MRKVEYKINTVLKTATEQTYIGKFNYIEAVEDVDPITGEPIIRYDREKIQEFQFRFPIKKPDSEIFDFLKQVGAIYGEVINE